MDVTIDTDQTADSRREPERSYRRPVPALTKRRLLGAGGLLTGATLAACGTFPGSEAPAASQQPKTVVFHTDWITGVRGELVKQALAQWAQTQPKIRIDKQDAASGTGVSFIDQMVARISSDTIGDMALWDYWNTEIWAKRGVFSNITPVLKKLKYNVDEQNIYVRESIFWKDRQFGMPFQIRCFGWVYNRSAFLQQSVPEPQENWTWDTLIETARRLNQPEQNQWGLLPDDAFWSIIYQHGGEVVSQDRKKTLFDTPQTLAGLEFVTALYQRHRIAPPPAVQTERQLRTTTGNYRIWFDGGAGPGLQTQIGNLMEIDLAPLPLLTQTGKRVTTMNDQPHVVFAAAQKHNVLEEVTQFALYMAGDFVGGLFVDLNAGAIPTKKSALNSPTFLKSPPRNTKRLMDGFKYARPSLDFGAGIPFQSSWVPFRTRMYNGELSPREAAQLMVAAGDTALANGSCGVCGQADIWK